MRVKLKDIGKFEIRQSGMTTGIFLQAIGLALSNAGRVVKLVFPKNTNSGITKMAIQQINSLIARTGSLVTGEPLKGFTVTTSTSNNIPVIEIITNNFGSNFEGKRLTKKQYEERRPFIDHEPSILI